MAIFQDFLLNSSGDLLIENGDFVIGPSDNQHIFDILTSPTGAFKEFPILGCNLMQDLKGQNPQQSAANCKSQLQSDGYQLGGISLTIDSSGNLNISFPNGITRP